MAAEDKTLVQEAAVTQLVEVAEAGLGAASGPSPAPSRRDRQRAATTEEIIQTARQLLVQNGPEAVSLRAIAREMGMTAPGLYRYFGSHEELLRHVCADIFTELGGDIHRAIEAATEPAEPPSDQMAVKLTVKMVAACREFRRWALDHKPEFGLLFGVPLPGLDDGRYDIADECALAFAGPSSRCSSNYGGRLRSRCPPSSRSTPGCVTSSAAIATRWAPTFQLARCSRSCAAGRCCTGRCRWKCSAT